MFIIQILNIFRILLNYAFLPLILELAAIAPLKYTSLNSGLDCRVSESFPRQH